MKLLSVLLEGFGGGDYTWILMIAIFGVFYFFIIRPQNKKQKEVANFRKGLAIGDKVITAGGIHGKIKEVREDILVLEIAENTRIKIEKSSVFASATSASESGDVATK